MRVKGARSSDGAEAPDIAQQLFLREHAPLVRHQLQQELVLLAGETHVAARDGDGARGGVYADRPGHGDVVLDLRRAAKDCADPRYELLVIERAREEVVG